MKFLISFVIFLIAFYMSKCDAKISYGTCAKVPVITDFDASKYVGVWYEIQRFPVRFEKDMTCVYAEYGLINSTAISVRNCGKKHNVVSSVNGTATIPNPAEPNKLIVKFSFKVLDIIDITVSGSYNVWDTDYSTYSLVYSCEQFSFFGLANWKKENVWILSRAKTLDQNVVNRLYSTLKANNVDPSNFEITDQKNCD